MIPEQQSFEERKSLVDLVFQVFRMRTTALIAWVLAYFSMTGVAFNDHTYLFVVAAGVPWLALSIDFVVRSTLYCPLMYKLLSLESSQLDQEPLGFLLAANGSSRLRAAYERALKLNEPRERYGAVWGIAWKGCLLLRVPFIVLFSALGVTLFLLN